MARGIIYCMTTIVPGLVKIGKTGKDNFEQRMYNLEHNGYVQVVGLKRRFAIEVDDYDEKETLIHELFSKSNVPNTELFAVEQRQFIPASSEIQKNTYGANKYLIPNGLYYITEKVRGIGIIKATMRAENGKFVVLKGSQCLPCNKDWMPETRRTAKIENGILMEDVECKSPSTAGWVVLGNANNGWITWKTEEGKNIDIFRNNK